MPGTGVGMSFHQPVLGDAQRAAKEEYRPNTTASAALWTARHRSTASRMAPTIASRVRISVAQTAMVTAVQPLQLTGVARRYQHESPVAVRILAAAVHAAIDEILPDRRDQRVGNSGETAPVSSISLLSPFMIATRAWWAARLILSQISWNFGDVRIASEARCTRPSTVPFSDERAVAAVVATLGGTPFSTRNAATWSLMFRLSICVMTASVSRSSSASTTRGSVASGDTALTY